MTLLWTTRFCACAGTSSTGTDSPRVPVGRQAGGSDDQDCMTPRPILHATDCLQPHTRPAISPLRPAATSRPLLQV